MKEKEQAWVDGGMVGILGRSLLWLVETLSWGGTEHGGARKQDTLNQDGEAGCWVSFSTGTEEELVRAGGVEVTNRGVLKCALCFLPAGEQAAVVFL